MTIENVNFNGPEWAAIERWLLSSREKKTALLVNSDSHDESNKIRGALMLITEILAQKKAAQSSR